MFERFHFEKREDRPGDERLNAGMVYGWLVIVVVLMISYTIEMFRGYRTESYLLYFSLVTVVPAIIVFLLYHWRPQWFYLRYMVLIGYLIMYTYVMATGYSIMVFSYILPLLSLLVLYHDVGLVVLTGIIVLVINGVQVYFRISSGVINSESLSQVEIQIGCLVLCFTASIVGAKIYGIIDKKNAKFREDMQEMTIATIRTIANTIDAKDEYTTGHSRRVSDYSGSIAAELGYTEDQVADIKFIALLHDIGKIGVPDSVLNKPGKLTDDEYQLMKNHTIIGADILKDIGMIPEIDVGAKYHHERYDGRGYPEGLEGDEIPKIARIIAVADAYDAMTSTRIYRNRLDPSIVEEEIEKGLGTQFDPEAGSAMLRLLREGRLVQEEHYEEPKEVREATELLSRVMEKQEEQLASNYMHDELTGAYNRNYGIKLLQEATRQGQGTMFIFDIDQFHVVNETEGYMVGDIYLQTVAKLIDSFREKGIVARFGADEFVAVFPRVITPEHATRMAEKFREKLNAKKNEQVSLGKLNVSIGIAMIDHEKEEFNVVYERADKALYVAKHQSEDGYYIHWKGADEIERQKKASADLKSLVGVLKNREKSQGGLEVDLPAFTTMLNYITDVAERNHQHVRLLLFTLMSDQEHRVSVDETDRVMTILERAILKSIRSVDATTKYSSTQRIVLLLNMDEDQVHVVTDRIMMEFYKMYDKKQINIHYDSADLSNTK
ncbi:MAG: diguanylate cyclase [Eubacterium sp.]|nr:diguanylate cyclase [Eubacterium sp.]